VTSTGPPFRIDVFTIFPSVLEGYGAHSILGRAQEAGRLDLRVRDLRAGAEDRRRSVDDAPFGGGAGMVLMAEPVFRSVETVEAREGLPRPLLLLSPGGERFDQRAARRLAGGEGFSLLCGRYEGVDQRVVEHLTDGELSVGDYVLAGGELAALVVVEVVARLLPGVLGNEGSVAEESFTDELLEYPQYTRPATFRGWSVPEVLRSGDHGRIARWRRAQSLLRTLRRRPDLLAARGALSDEELELLDELGGELGDRREVRALLHGGYDGDAGDRRGAEEPVADRTERLSAERLTAECPTER
jgi:tRNA (guanine37-N1)-methyltransferase